MQIAPRYTITEPILPNSLAVGLGATPNADLLSIESPEKQTSSGLPHTDLGLFANEARRNQAKQRYV